MDASISLHVPGEPLGTRVEIKNINSFKHIQKAIDYEIRRQHDVLVAGESVENETRQFNSSIG